MAKEQIVFLKTHKHERDVENQKDSCMHVECTLLEVVRNAPTQKQNYYVDCAILNNHDVRGSSTRPLLGGVEKRLFLIIQISIDVQCLAAEWAIPFK